MAGRVVPLPWLVALLALSGSAFGRFQFLTSRRCTILSSNDCLPENFFRNLPGSVTSASMECRMRSTLGGFGWRPWRRGRGKHAKSEERKAEVLQCMSSSLDITNDAGLDETALDDVLESLSSNTTFTDQLKAIADTCIAAMNSTLTADQQGVFVLSCLKYRQKADCSLQNENSTLCLNAKTLIKCPIGIKPLVSSSNLRACKESEGSEFLNDIPDFFSNPDSTLCPSLEETAKSVANCSLQAASLASGDTMNLTAVETAINDSPDTNDVEKARQLDVLNTCQTNGADTVEAFLDCWAAETVDGCVISQSERLAAAVAGGSSSRRLQRRPSRRNRFSWRRLRRG